MHSFINRFTLGLLLCTFSLTPFSQGTATAQEAQVQCFMLELFYDSSDDGSTAVKDAFTQYGEDHVGVKLYYRDILDDEKGQKRLKELQDYFRLKEVALPAVYGLKTFESGLDSKDKLYEKIGKMLTLTAFVRNGCPHCRDAKAFLAKYGNRYPALKIVYREVTTDRTANSDMQAIVRRYGQRAASLPVVHFCNGLSIGFGTERTTGVKILKTLDYWSEGCTLEKKN